MHFLEVVNMQDFFFVFFSPFDRITSLVRVLKAMHSLHSLLRAGMALYSQGDTIMLSEYLII